VTERKDVEAVITFRWPCSLTRAQLDALKHDDAYEIFLVELKNRIHNELDSIIGELIVEERYEVDIVERDPA
jgi:hypothetical protein